MARGGKSQRDRLLSPANRYLFLWTAAVDRQQGHVSAALLASRGYPPPCPGGLRRALRDRLTGQPSRRLFVPVAARLGQGGVPVARGTSPRVN